jgi:hypothetical protein
MDTGDPEENRKRWRRIKMAWRAWRLYDKGSGWWQHAGGLGAVKANVAMAAAVAATATAGTYGAIALRDTYIAPKQAVETAAISPAPAEVRQTKNSVVFAIEGKDKTRRRGTFDVVVLNKNFIWVRGSAEELEKDGKAIPAGDVASAVLDDEVRAALADAEEVITVGTASQEGDASEELARCQSRDAHLDPQPRSVSRAMRQLRDRRHELAAPLHRDRGKGARRGAERRHERTAEAADPQKLFRLRADEGPLTCGNAGLHKTRRTA